MKVGRLSFLPNLGICRTSLALFVGCLFAGAGFASNTSSTEGSVIFFCVSVVPAIAAVTSWVVLSRYPDDFRLVPSDRKNLFRAELIELIGLNRQLQRQPGLPAAEQRQALCEEIDRLRKWPKEHSKDELLNAASYYVSLTQPDRDVALVSARQKLAAYDTITEEFQHDPNP